MSQTFESFSKEGYNALHENQELFLAKHEINSYARWDFDQPSGVFMFSDKPGDNIKKYFAFQSIGTYSPTAGTWMWSWANKTTYPNVKTASEQIKEFGEKAAYEKLITASWEADEIDGWEMLAFTQKIIKPIGTYRVSSGGLLHYLIFINELSEAEALEMKENATELIQCNTHGLRRMAFVCQHLNKTQRTGFHEAFETEPGMELYEDDDFQAWCDDCETIRLEDDGWNEKAMEFAKIKLVCESCYFEMKDFNT
ncbi:DUF6882 domain-containing protein [Flavobacterium sp. RHBU_3]|uniref:DUF6882 domain-containing protein n=1 Tax=Flavobacterium sp. RHBU_3 TaxID=3391184 RepID=UPI0039846F6E